jgi:hypothetical protein
MSDWTNDINELFGDAPLDPHMQAHIEEVVRQLAEIIADADSAESESEIVQTLLDTLVAVIRDSTERN